MPKQKNVSVVSELKEKVEKAKSMVLTDYRGLTHKQAEELHRALTKVDGEFVVVKNTLLKIASKDSQFGLEKLDNSQLSGPTAVLLSYGDELAPVKELYKTIKALSLPVVKAGIIGGVHYDSKQMNEVAKLPAKEVMQAMLVSRLSGPMYGLLYTLNGNLNKLVYVLSQIKN